ncbi:helix-turn-helix transcriptional regulator [Yinghuangia seranimata]|uniref:helix-turn-helix transcriptional regulator n=1 Tax=Yinghuangia seranimata TaxID=408067 RepID=UPI00248CE95F|nr:helix-turn-helix transcriptional regulator [Yinghuangia seranimata]MDI2132364.1 helix-turn-helix transcriptional regulator [Yinghuangia seranimata]
MDMDRRELADFLRRSRERLRPADVGLPEGPRRRTPGLRREEVTSLAGMSPDYYMRLEQARSPQPSTQMLGALARALRLNDDERDHLYLLAGHRPPAGRQAGEAISPALRHLLDNVEHTPAQIISDLGDLLAQNALAQALFGGVCTVSEHGRNITWRWFTDPAVRSAYPVDEWDHYSRVHVADLRSAVARRSYDGPSTHLVRRLRDASPEFAGLWELHEVGVRRRSRMSVLHPVVGRVDLDLERLLTPSEDQALMIFTPPPGSPYASQLDLLRVVGGETFATGDTGATVAT